jgi:hypothetical protein
MDIPMAGSKTDGSNNTARYPWGQGHLHNKEISDRFQFRHMPLKCRHDLFDFTCPNAH